MMRSEHKKYRHRDHCARRNYDNCVQPHPADMAPNRAVSKAEWLPQSMERAVGRFRWPLLSMLQSKITHQRPHGVAAGDVIPTEEPQRRAVRKPDFEAAALRNGFVFDQADGGHDPRFDRAGREAARAWVAYRRGDNGRPGSARLKQDQVS
jgi:hypothetical protein